MSFPGNALPSFPSSILAEEKPNKQPNNNTMSTLNTIKAELTFLGNRINDIMRQLPHTAFSVIEKLEQHLGIDRGAEHPAPALHAETLATLDNRLGNIVKRLEHCTAEEITEVEEHLGMHLGDIPEAQAPADTTENGAAPSGASTEAPTPDQAVS
jgi:hypothetical protein